MSLSLEQLRAQYGEAILALAAKYDLHNVRVYGLVARNEATQESDLDILVERVTNGDPWGIGGFYMDMQELMCRKVDVATDSGLSKYVKDKVLSEAVPL